MTHQNIRHLDKVLHFPKKTYAIRQNPNEVAQFNETRIIFQRLADIFWPGAVILYVQPESLVPHGLVHRTAADATAENTGNNDDTQNSSNDRISSAAGQHQYVGLRCPSHPLAVKILKQIQQDCSDPSVVLVGSVARQDGSSMFKAKDVAHNLGSNLSHLNSRIQVLNGEERREIFAVPTCEFRDEWLECWINSEARTVTLKNNSKAAVGRHIRGHHMLRETNTKNKVIRSILHCWKVVDLTQE
jgi:Telomere recombination